MKRTFDFFSSLIALAVLSPLMFIIAALVKLTSPGPILYWSDRVGRNNTIFKWYLENRSLLLDLKLLC